MKKEFGTTRNGETASCYILKNSKGMKAVVSDFGAALLKLTYRIRMESLRMSYWDTRHLRIMKMVEIL